jgi:uncharacterized protein YqhQ
MQEIHRVFQYHGAEHKAIWTYEQGQPLTTENAARFTTLHPRCGTSFLIIVLGISIVVFAIVFPFIPQFTANKAANNLLMVFVKIPLMFPIAGLSYEFQRLSARPNAPRFVKWLTAPGLQLQKITTQEPTKDQLEISLVALGRALAHEQGRLSESGVRVFHDFDGAIAVP